MARKQKSTADVANVHPYLEGVAKNLVDRLYGASGPVWGTKFTELEETVAAVRKVLSESMLQQMLDRQSTQVERPPEYEVCPGCGQPTRATEQPEPRRLETGGGDAVWQEPKARCQKCRRDFFPSEQEFGD